MSQEMTVSAFLQTARLLEAGWEWTPFGWPMQRLSPREWEAKCAEWMARTEAERERAKAAGLTAAKAS